MRRLAFCGFIAAVALAQSDMISVRDPHPLAAAARILSVRYGVPISYEELSSPTFTSLEFSTQPLNIAYAPKPPVDVAAITRVLQSALDALQKNGNPMRFKLLQNAQLPGNW
ncbi:MAG TPA: hypothetical protein VGN17_07175 [Bryobacteraceae bacterium]|jgi:hypothetical protein